MFRTRARVWGWVVSSILSLSAAAQDPGDDWPQWRGPLGTGVAPKATPPTEWSETKNVRWKSVVPGFGTSTPIVWKDRIYLLTSMPADLPETETSAEARPAPAPAGGGGQVVEKPAKPYRFQVIALDRQTGQPVWRRTVAEEIPHEGHHKDHGFASSSPVTDGNWLIVSFGSRGIYGLDLTGQVKWEKRLGRMQTRNGFGEGASPAVHGDVVVIPWDHEGEDFVVALDKKSGRELWRQARSEPTSWSTPLVVEHPGRTEVVVSSTGRIRSYELVTGRQLWECGGMTLNVIPTPVVDETTAYLLSGFRGAAILAIRLGRDGDLTDTDAIRWKHGKSAPYVPSPLLYDGALYFLSGNNAMLSRFATADGRPDYEAERLEGVFGVYGSPVGAAGRVYVVGRDGKTAVLRHGPKLDVLAVNTLDDRFDASPVPVGRELLLRGHRHLYSLADD